MADHSERQIGLSLETYSLRSQMQQPGAKAELLRGKIPVNRAATGKKMFFPSHPDKMRIRWLCIERSRE